MVTTFDRKGIRRRDENCWKALDETNSTVSVRAHADISLVRKKWVQYAPPTKATDL